MTTTATTPEAWGHRLITAVMAPAYWIERARGRKRLALILLYLAVGFPFGVLACALSLVGLPDVGDPFDLAAFESRTVPDDRNAFVLYREAKAKLQPLRFDYARKTAQGTPIHPSFDWATAQPEVKQWLADNAEALELWRLGTERPEAQEIPWKDLRIDSRLDTLQALREFALLAQLEADRRLQAGDMAGAYAIYRAILRCAHHCDWDGTLIGRLIGAAIQRMVSGRIDKWAADPRTNAALLKQAAADLQTLADTQAPNSLSFRCEYALALRTMADATERAKLHEYEGNSLRAWYEFSPRLQALDLWLRHEPERSRRVYRLLMTNVLAHCDTPRDRRPQIADAPFLFYQRVPGAPPEAHRMTAAELETWFQSAPIARMIVPTLTNALAAMDRQNGRLDLLRLLVAEQTYRREHDGQPPATLGQLVGPYLDALPEGFDPNDPAVTAIDAPTAVAAADASGPP